MKRRPPVKWSPKMLAQLRHMWRVEGLYSVEIAGRLGLTSGQVTDQASRLQLCLHPSRSPRSDNLRTPRRVWGGSDFDFWRQPDIEASRA